MHLQMVLLLILLFYCLRIGCEAKELHLTTSDEGYMTVIQGFAARLECMLHTCVRHASTVSFHPAHLSPVRVLCQPNASMPIDDALPSKEPSSTSIYLKIAHFLGSLGIKTKCSLNVAVDTFGRCCAQFSVRAKSEFIYLCSF